ncbi:uncharacterized protein LOC120287158 [Eucalyptus grandis]|uniref:uncharacterized protein LOC120287158 n=1 Tax=Eucalyptus grandis TaxID=71139 RepID=UPI00192EE522|nr:uncharacterized protein LOC120287158 [Eucalyptus grandis]
MPQKSVKGRVIADVLAKNPRISNNDDHSLDDRVLYVSEESWTMFFDGAVNLYGSNTGAVLISPDGQHHPVAAKLMLPCTNNVAEYEACILGLQAAIEMGVAKLKVLGYSAFIIWQTVGEWKTKDAKLLSYHEYLKDLVKEFEEISFEYLPRSHNQFVDALETLSSMFQVADGLEVEPLKIEVLLKPTYYIIVTEEPNGKPWVVEAANKNIKKILAKTVENYRDWLNRLPFALMAYRTLIRTSTKVTPFALVYNMEAILLVEVEIPSLRVLSQMELLEAEWS